MLPWLDDSLLFPPLTEALTEPNGLLAVGGDLSPERILAAYRCGIFPWFAPDDPILWWSPDPRMILVPDEFRRTRSLTKTLRKDDYDVRFDSAFPEVIAACARTPRNGQNGTWISNEMIAAYTELHRLGHAHSVETWRDGRLIGGLYGLAIGKAFFGESMFAHATDASKIALAHLVKLLRARDFGIIDCQMETAHLASLGARPIPRHDFATRIDLLCANGPSGASWNDVVIARSVWTLRDAS